MNYSILNIQMQLEDNHTTISARTKHLQAYLKQAPHDKLSPTDFKTFKQLFAKYYTPDEGELKPNTDDFYQVSVENSSHGNNQFHIYLADGTNSAVSLKHLAGSNRTQQANLIRAMRNCISPQILDFIKQNPLNPEATCPLMGELVKLGFDAQVAHHPKKFSEIATDFITNYGIKIPITYDQEKNNYTINYPHDIAWYDYHKQQVQNTDCSYFGLRWVSKLGNQFNK